MGKYANDANFANMFNLANENKKDIYNLANIAEYLQDCGKGTFNIALHDDCRALRKLFRSRTENLFLKKSFSKDLAKEFLVYYKEFYKVNDFTLSSVCQSNTKEETKALWSAFLANCKEVLTTKK